MTLNPVTWLSDWWVNLSNRRRWWWRAALWLAVVLLLGYVFFMPLKSVPLATPLATSTPQAIQATERFWQILHEDDFESLPGVLVALANARVDAPDDVQLATILGAAHLWHFDMRSRYQKTAQEMRASLVAAIEISEAAVKLAPDDNLSIAPSIATAATWFLFSTDEKTGKPDGAYERLLRNSIVYPEFSGFVQGWIAGAMLPADDPNYSDSTLGYHFMMSTCAGFELPPNLQFTKFVHTVYGLKSIASPVCYNNPVAPHSIEGTLFSIGDAWLKAGDLKKAELWYNNAKTSPTYSTWQYQHMLDDRLARLDFFVEKFRADSGKLDVEAPAMSGQSGVSCGICHTR